MNSNFQNLSENEPAQDDDATEKIVMLPVFENDPRRVVTMMNPAGHVVGQVRVGSLVYRVMLANHYRVMQR